MKNIKYTPKILFAVIHFALLIVVLILFFGRKDSSLRVNALLNLLPDFYQHISNFCISYLLFAGIGFIWLLLGVKFKWILQLGIAILLLNFIFELWITVLNTPDIIDAYYGLAGTVLAFLFLFILNKKGLNVNTTTGNV